MSTDGGAKRARADTSTLLRSRSRRQAPDDSQTTLLVRVGWVYGASRRRSAGQSVSGVTLRRQPHALETAERGRPAAP